MESQIVCYT